MEKLRRIGIISISLITIMCGAAVSPGIASIGRAFPNASASLLETIITLPSLFIVIFSLIAGKLTSIFSKKHILIAGLILYTIGGAGVAATNTISSLLIFRAILGMGCGLVMPLSQALITDFFEKSEMTKVTGYSTAASNFMGVVSSIFVGVVSVINWRYGFYVYFIALVPLILNIISLPNQKIQKQHKEKVNINKKIYIIAMGMFLITIAFYTSPLNMSLFLEEEHIGGSSLSGIALAISTFGAFVSGMILSKIKNRIKGFTVPLAIGLMCIGYGSVFYAYSQSRIMASMIFIGLGIGIIYPSIFVKTSSVAKGKSNSVSMSIVSSAMFLGQFLAPFVLGSISRGLKFTAIRSQFAFTSICLGVACIISIVIQFNLKRNTKKIENAA